MTLASEARPFPAAAVWSGRVLSGLVALALFLDAGVKLVFLRDMPEASAQLGWPAQAVTPLGVTLFLCTALYVAPRTSILGAILLTGYLGGAVATHARIGSPLFSHILFGVYLGVAVWGGLYLRNPDVRRLIPWRTT